jgi:hypothetical protein
LDGPPRQRGQSRFSAAKARPFPFSYGHDGASRLNGVSTGAHKARRGFELMKTPARTKLAMSRVASLRKTRAGCELRREKHSSTRIFGKKLRQNADICG